MKEELLAYPVQYLIRTLAEFIIQTLPYRPEIENE